MRGWPSVVLEHYLGQHLGRDNALVVVPNDVQFLNRSVVRNRNLDGNVVLVVPLVDVHRVLFLVGVHVAVPHLIEPA